MIKFLDDDEEYFKKYNSISDVMTDAQRREMYPGASFPDMHALYGKQFDNPELHRSSIVSWAYETVKFARGEPQEEQEDRKEKALRKKEATNRAQNIGYKITGKEPPKPMDFSFLKSLFLTEKTKKDVMNVVSSAWAKNHIYKDEFPSSTVLIECAEVEVLITMNKDRNISPNEAVQLLARKIMPGGYKYPHWYADYKYYKDFG